MAHGEDSTENELQLGTIAAVSIRRARGVEPSRVGSAVFVTAQGIAGDYHADPLSMRQLLIASTSAYGQLGLPPHSLRENLLVTFDTSTLRSGTIVRVGQDVLLWLTFQCEACGHLNRHQEALSKRIGEKRGVLARVLRGGTVTEGDTVASLGVGFAAWADGWRERLHQVLNKVPVGFVVEYRQLARFAGVPSSYCRVFPRVIRELGVAYVSRVVPKDALPDAPRWDGSSLFDQKVSIVPTSCVPSVRKSRRNLIYTKDIMTMDSASELKLRIVGRLKSIPDGAAHTLEVCGARIVLAQTRTLRRSTAPVVEMKPYPKVACALADDYDSWLS